MKTLGVEDDTQASAVGIDNLLNWTDKHDGNRQSGKSTKPADRQADKHRPESKAVRRPAGVGPQHVDIDQQRDSRIDDIALPPRPALFSAQRQKNTKLTTPGGTKDAKKNELTNIFSKPQEKQSMRKSESKEKPITLVKNTPSKSKQSSINNSKNDEQKIPNDIENQNIAQVFQLQSVRGIGSQEHKSYSEQRAMFKPIIQTEAVLLMQDKPKADGGHKSTVTTSKLPSIGNRPSHVRGSVPARDKSTVMQEGVKVSITHAGIARLTSAKPVANQKVFLDHGQVKVHDREKLGELQRPARTPSALTKHHFRKPEFRPPSVRKQSAVKHRSFNKSAKNDGVKLRERDREIQMVLDLPDDSSSSEENVRIKTLTAKRIPPIASLQQEEIGNIRYVSAMKPEVIVKPSKHGVGAKNLANKASLKKIVLEVTQEIEMSPGGSEDHQNLAENDQAYNSKSELVNQITFEVAEKDKGVEKLPRLTQHLQSYKQAKPAMAIKFTQEESPIRSRNTDSFLSNTDKRLKPGIKSILGTPLDPSPSKVPVDQQQAFPFDMEYDDIDQEGIALMSPSSRAKLALSRDLKMERSIDASVNSLYSALIKAFTQVILNSMLDFLGSVIEREDEPKEEDLAKFESLFRSDLSKAQPKDIVGVYKVLHLKVELKKCKDRIKESMAAIKV